MVTEGKEKRSIVGSFILGFVFGVVGTLYLMQQFASGSHVVTFVDQKRNEEFNVSDSYYPVKVDDTTFILPDELQMLQSHNYVREFDQDVIADALFSKVRVLCFVVTSPQNLRKKAVHVKATWAKRCNKVLFISSETDPDFPTIKVKAKEGREYLWQKTRHALQLIYEQYLDDADWFIKADDDTFLIAENLRYFLSSYDPSQSIYFGHRFKKFVKQGYMSGGGGYVISKEGVKKLVEKSFADSNLCWPGHRVGGFEDVEIGRCLQNAGVEAGDSRDPTGRDRFHPFPPENHLEPHTVPKDYWYRQYAYYNTSLQMGPECCSDYSISFHHVPPNELYLLDYLIYHMKPFGVGHYRCPSEAQPLLEKLLNEGEDKAMTLMTAEQNDNEEIGKEEEEERTELVANQR